MGKYGVGGGYKYKYKKCPIDRSIDRFGQILTECLLRMATNSYVCMYIPLMGAVPVEYKYITYESMSKKWSRRLLKKKESDVCMYNT